MAAAASKVETSAIDTAIVKEEAEKSLVDGEKEKDNVEVGKKATAPEPALTEAAAAAAVVAAKDGSSHNYGGGCSHLDRI